METRNILIRANLYSVVWATVMNLILAFSGCANLWLFDSPLTLYSSGLSFGPFFFGELLFFAVGFLIALPFSLVLSFYEWLCQPTQLRLLLASVLLGVGCQLLPLLWWALGYDAAISVRGMDNVTFALELTAALMSGYMVVRCLPFKRQERQPDRPLMWSVVLLVK